MKGGAEAGLPSLLSDKGAYLACSPHWVTELKATILQGLVLLCEPSSILGTAAILLEQSASYRSQLIE